MDAKDRIIVALDVDNLDKAKSLVDCGSSVERRKP